MDTIEIEEKNSANTGLKWGGYAGVAYVFITYFLFLIFKDAQCVIGPYSMIPYCSMIIFMIIAGLEKRKLMGGFISFRTALKNTFLVLVITTLVFAFFQYALYNFMQPALKESVKQFTLHYVDLFLSKMKYNQDQYDEMIAAYKNSSSEMPLFRILQQSVVSIVFGFFWAAVTALIVRRKPKTVTQ
jgi:hypothetical protein